MQHAEAGRLASLFGFTEDEVKGLCKKHGANFAEIKNWYDGYRLGGSEIYNPKSVVEAIQNGECGDYWVTTSATEAITSYMNFDKGALKQTIAEMLTGEKARLDATEFGNDLTQVDSQDAALCVLIHLGYLAYDAESKSCYVPQPRNRRRAQAGREEAQAEAGVPAHAELRGAL